MITLVIPAYSSGPAIERTIASAKGLCDEVVIISTALFPEDNAAFSQLTERVVGLPWNFVFLHGFGPLYNQGTKASKNDWLLLLGVAETVAELYVDIKSVLSHASSNNMFRCSHVNDPNRWKRIWNRTGGTQWSGLIHEEVVGGTEGDVLFRMQDTPKEPRADIYQNEALRLIKVCSYHVLYQRLRLHPEMLGGANAGWLEFVKGSKEANEDFLEKHKSFVTACLSGDLSEFLALVKERVNQTQPL